MGMLRKILPVMALLLYLGIHDGRLALFRQGHRVPVQVYATAISSYPLKDQQALAAGIPIKNNRHLAKLLEAYLS